MGFQYGLSGLNAAARNLDVIGNNVANSNTVGAKASKAEFAELYATSLSGGSGFGGIGVSVAGVSQSFAQGDISASNNPLDMAINGNGFFQMQSSNGTATYGRNGQFKLDKDGYIVNNQGSKLMGYQGNGSGAVPVGVPGPLKIDTSDVKPKATDSASMTLNLDARLKNVPGSAAFDPTKSDSYSSATSMSVFDAQGGERTLSVYFQKTGANAWDVYAVADGAQVGTGRVGHLQFDAAGQLDTAASSGTTNPIALAIPALTTASGSTLGAVNVDVDMSKLTQFGSAFSVTDLKQDGYASGRLSGYSVANDGTIQARYTNGQTVAQGQIVLASFTNPQGLQPLGGNAWQQTVASGAPLVGVPGSASLGQLQSGALESSNVDLTAELVNMITAQRSYQANAQTIRAQDQMLQTIVNLR